MSIATIDVTRELLDGAEMEGCQDFRSATICNILEWWEDQRIKGEVFVCGKFVAGYSPE